MNPHINGRMLATLLASACIMGATGDCRGASTDGLWIPAVPNSQADIAIELKKAEAGDVTAQFAIGIRNFGHDSAKAIFWLEKAASQRHAEAQYFLGMGYLLDRFGRTDTKKAAEWLKKAAEVGFPAAQHELALLYARGKGVNKDIPKALMWIQKSVDGGYSEAQYKLGLSYLKGEGPIPKDVPKGLDLLRKAVAQNNLDARRALANIYLDGKLVARDSGKAIAMYEAMAAEGNTKSYSDLGRIYTKGEVVPKDDLKAAKWYQTGAALGDSGSQYKLSLNFTLGSGVPEDWVLAYAWANLAAAQVPYYKGHLNSLTIRLSAAQLAEAQRLSSNWKVGQILVRERTSSQAPQVGTTGIPRKVGSGTVFLVSKAGHAITNQHVIAGCTEVRVQGREGVAKVVTEDSVNDLALLQLQGGIKDAAPITSEPNKLRQGEDVVVFGFPLNSVLSSGGNLTPGVVSAMTGLGNNTNQIQITAPIQPGSSGSPVLNKRGEVIAVVSMKLSDSKMFNSTGSVGQNVNFAVNGQTLKTFLDNNHITYNTGGGFFNREKSTADLADEARKWTLVAECWK